MTSEQRPSTRPARAPHPNPVKLCGEPAPQPAHICAFVGGTDDKYDMLAGFFRDAIDAGDLLINIVDAEAMEDHVRQLEEREVPMRRAIETNHLTLTDAESTYLRDGTVDVDGVFDLVRQTLARGLEDGRSVRSCGDMSWITRAPETLPAVMAYEARINLLLPTCECTLLCLYDLTRIPAYLVTDVLATHEYAIMNGRLRRNPYFVPPTEYLDMLTNRDPSLRRAGE